MNNAVRLASQTSSQRSERRGLSERWRETRLRRVMARVRIGSTAWVYIGIVVAFGGLGLIGYAWGRVAGLAHVALQIPYLISAGMVGLGLTAVGIGVAHFAAQHRDQAERAVELKRLGDVLESVAHELKAALEEKEGGS